MRCKLCSKPAVYAPLRFCDEHFLRFYENKVRHYFDTTHVKNRSILIAVSGGKDSSALADVMVRIAPEYGLTLGLFTIDLRIPDYSSKGVAAVRELAARLKLPLIVEDLSLQPKTIPNFAASDKPCGACGTIKRYLLNKSAMEHGYAALATGHNLDDEFYFAMHNLTHKNLEQLRRADKALPPRPEHKLAGRIKPLYYLTEKENRLYCLLRGVPHDADECPYSVDNPQVRFKAQAQFNREEKRSLLKSLQALRQPAEETKDGAAPGELHPCPRCGYATISNAECAYCKLMQR